MREIRFRAFDRETKKMFMLDSLILGATKASWIKKSDGFARMLVFGENADLMQGTGSKDAKGNEIYEGDILCRPAVGVNLQVRWNEIHSQFDLVRPSESKDFECACVWFRTGDYEIIGNVHENRELLTKE